ncbi:MAG: hypothetical protein Q7T36_01715 [Fluviicoccus sp.]|uniref:hypothetical protein n=1 Tax=Fluviicoccus sp. TaxID=2003552 RepID=UPI0027212216|nr:hypothetical protein [Fluviicoccus sp.]MDO8329173.1 hypothetical protein [Fluviicoccus sp.]
MTFTQPHALTLAILAATLGLTACNSNDDDGSLPGAAVAMKSVTIVPSLGKISNGRVVLRNARNPADRRGTLGDSLPIRADGSVTFQVPATVPELLAELEPTNQTTYFDEGVADNPATAGIDESHPAFPLTQTLRVAFRQADLDAQGRVAMTALTEAAVSRALALAGTGSLADYIDAANAFIESVFKIASVHQVPVLLDDETDYRDRLIGASNAAARDYAMRLAALAQQARTANAADPTPALTMMKALSEDLSRDNALDGKRNGVGIDGVPYDFNVFLTAWRNAMTQLLSAIKLGLGEGALTQAQLTDLTNLFNTLATNLQLDRTPPVGGATPVRIINGIAEYACADRNRIKSQQGNTQLDIDFVNNSGQTINIDWINFTGQSVRYRTALTTGNTYQQGSTFLMHPWLLTNGAGECKGIFAATTTGKKTITLNADGTTTLAGAGGGGISVPAGLVGNYNLKYSEFNAGGPFANNATVAGNISATGELTINGKTLSNPNIRAASPTVIYWTDGPVEYAVTDATTGILQAINLFDTSKAGLNYGQFAKAVVTQGCTSQGADNKIGFANAPDDFCGFTRAVSEIITSGSTQTYSFRTADADIRFLVINYENGVLKNVLAESSNYSFGCGAFGERACTGIDFRDGVNNKEFVFSNTVLDPKPGMAGTQPLTLVSGSVIHPVAVDPNAPIRIENGVEFYNCATWRQIPSGGATSNVSLNFINQRGNSRSSAIYVFNSNTGRNELKRGDLLNGTSFTATGMHNRMVMVDDNANNCVAVLKAVTAGDKNITLNADDSVSVSNVVAPPPAGVTITLNENACSGSISTLRQNCGVTTTNDFSINNLKTENGGTDCTLTKNGGNVTINLNGKSITASLDAEAGDSLSLLAGGDRLIAANTVGNSISYRINSAGKLLKTTVTSILDGVNNQSCIP